MLIFYLNGFNAMQQMSSKLQLKCDCFKLIALHYTHDSSPHLLGGNKFFLRSSTNVRINNILVTKRLYTVESLGPGECFYDNHPTETKSNLTVFILYLNLVEPVPFDSNVFLFHLNVFNATHMSFAIQFECGYFVLLRLIVHTTALHLLG